MDFSQLGIGFILGILIGLVAWRVGALSSSGATAASVVGGLIFGFGGVIWAAGLLTFFVSSSLLSKLFKNQKNSAGEKFAKGSQRDWAQVAANGALASALAVIQILQPDQGWPWVAFLGAIAAVNADTWATELGVLNKQEPRLITNGQPVEPGSSGAISTLGTAATLAGAALIGALSIFNTQLAWGPIFWAVTAGGLLGSLFDSLLGATIQAIYFCPRDHKETEQHPFHTCGTKTQHFRGLRWLNNDLVNFAASAVGAVSSTITWLVILTL